MTVSTKTLNLGTDVAHLLIFHPEDLRHTEGWPLGWYSEPPCYVSESGAGRLIAWCTGSDGGYKIRFTTGEPDAREAAFTRQKWVFPLTVRHGRVMIDNSDCLWGESRMTDPDTLELEWFDLPNGDYNVTVHAVEWNAEPGSDAEGFETLPNYVVAFAQRGDAPAAPVARRAPDLNGSPEYPASDEPFAFEPRPAEPVASLADFSGVLPALVAPALQPQGTSFQVERAPSLDNMLADPEESFALFDVMFVAVPDLSPGAIGQLCEVYGSSSSNGGAAFTYSLRSLGLVRLVGIDGPWPAASGAPVKTGLFGLGRKPGVVEGVMRVRAAPVEISDAPLPQAEAQLLRTQIVSALAPGAALAQRVGAAANYHALTLNAGAPTSQLIRFLMEQLPMNASERMSLAAMPVPDRARELLQRLARL